MGGKVSVGWSCSKYLYPILRPGTWKNFTKSILGTKLFPSLLPELQEAKKIVQDADILISTGGDVFSSEYGIRSIKRHLEPLKWAMEKNIPCVMLSHSIGPFKHPKELQLWQHYAKLCAHVSLRENKSFDYVVKDAGLPLNKVSLVGDVAFLLPYTDETISKERFQSYGLDVNAPTLALSVSRGISRYCGNKDEEAHTQALIEHCKLLRAQNIQVLLIPHVQFKPATGNDKVVAEQIKSAFAQDAGLAIAEGELSASDFKGLIRLCQMVVAERLHAAIAGLSSGICTMPIKYSVKADGIIGDLFKDENMAKAMFIPLDEFMDVPNSSNTIVKNWENREEINQALAVELPKMKNLAHQAFEELFAIIEKETK